MHGEGVGECVIRPIVCEWVAEEDEAGVGEREEGERAGEGRGVEKGQEGVEERVHRRGVRRKGRKRRGRWRRRGGESDFAAVASPASREAPGEVGSPSFSEEAFPSWSKTMSGRKRKFFSPSRSGGDGDHREDILGENAIELIFGPTEDSPDKGHCAADELDGKTTRRSRFMSGDSPLRTFLDDAPEVRHEFDEGGSETKESPQQQSLHSKAKKNGFSTPERRGTGSRKSVHKTSPVKRWQDTVNQTMEQGQLQNNSYNNSFVDEIMLIDVQPIVPRCDICGLVFDRPIQLKHHSYRVHLSIISKLIMEQERRGDPEQVQPAIL